MESQLKLSVEWCLHGAGIIRRDPSCLFNLDDLKDFIKVGEKLGGLMFTAEQLCYVPSATSTEQCSSQSLPLVVGGDTTTSSSSSSTVLTSTSLINDLRTELRRGKLWLARFQQTGADRGQIVGSEILEPLVAESKNICVDFGDQLELVQLVLVKYCLCRQPTHGHMIGCDTCEDWYHLDCVGFTKAQADKIDKYLCIRCSMRASFTSTISSVAMVANRWMNNEEIAKIKELRKQKLSKKRFKEERDVHRAESQVAEVNDSLRVLQAKAGGGGPANRSLLDTISKVLPLSTNAAAASPNSMVDETILVTQLRQYRVELEEARVRLGGVAMEETQLVRQLEIERIRHHFICEWMQAMQGVLWPTMKI